MRDVRVYDKDADELYELAAKYGESTATVFGLLVQKYGKELLEQKQDNEKEEQ